MITTIKTNNAQLLNYEELDIAAEVAITRHFNPNSKAQQFADNLIDEVFG
jgi:hypothetical protein